jgi:hypothetical protein
MATAYYIRQYDVYICQICSLPLKECQCTKVCNVWHIAQENGDVFPIVRNISEQEAQELANALQELNMQGLLPDEFYMASLVGTDADWEQVFQQQQQKIPPVDYLEIYRQHAERA